MTTKTCGLCGVDIHWANNRWRAEAGDPVCPGRGSSSGLRHKPAMTKAAAS